MCTSSQRLALQSHLVSKGGITLDLVTGHYEVVDIIYRISTICCRYAIMHILTASPVAMDIPVIATV